MTMHNALYLKNNVDHLYIPRKEGNRGLHSVEETVNLKNFGLVNYVKESRERLLTAARSMDTDLIERIQETTIEAKKQKKQERTILGRKKCCMVNLCGKLRKLGVKIGGNGYEIRR